MSVLFIFPNRKKRKIIFRLAVALRKDAPDGSGDFNDGDGGGGGGGRDGGLRGGRDGSVDFPGCSPAKPLALSFNPRGKI